VVDRVPAGVIEMVRAAGATVVTSANLVTRFFAVWTQAQLESHRRAAEIIARIAKEAFARAGASVRSGTPLAEHELMRWIQHEFTAGGLPPTTVRTSRRARTVRTRTTNPRRRRHGCCAPAIAC
jgi:Xaa-Pro aminopeptidase